MKHTKKEQIIELVSDACHEAWMKAKRSAGVESRKSETGEELMVPYAYLSEAAKDLDRVMVRGVLEAIEGLGFELCLSPQLHSAFSAYGAAHD